MPYHSSSDLSLVIPVKAGIFFFDAVLKTIPAAAAAALAAMTGQGKSVKARAAR